MSDPFVLRAMLEPLAPVCASHPYLSLEQFGRAVAALGLKLNAAEIERAFLQLDETRTGMTPVSQDLQATACIMRVFHY